MGLTLTVTAAVVQATLSAEIPVDETPRPPTFDRAFDASGDGDGAVIAWERTTPARALHVVRTGGAGATIAAHEIPFAAPFPADTAVSCEASFGGCLVAWSAPEAFVLDGAHAGPPLGPPLAGPANPAPLDVAGGLFVHGDAAPVAWIGAAWAPTLLQGAPDLTVAPGLAAWVQGHDVVVLPIDAAGTPLADPVVVATGSNPELPRLVEGPDATLLVWSDGTQSRIRALRLGAGGAPLDATPVELTDNTRWRIAPSAAPAPDGGWLVVWFDACDQFVAGVRLGADGALTGGTELRISPGRAGWDGVIRTSRPAVARAGDRWLVAYADARTPVTDGFGAAAVLVEDDGTPSAPALLGGRRASDVAAQADGVAIVWLDGTDVRARRLAWTGAAEDVRTVGEAAIPPRVLATSSGWRVLWGAHTGVELDPSLEPAGDVGPSDAADALLGLAGEHALWLRGDELHVTRAGDDVLVAPADPSASIAVTADRVGVLAGGVFTVLDRATGDLVSSTTVEGPATLGANDADFLVVPRRAAVAWDGDRFVVAWREGADLRLELLGAGGVPDQLEPDRWPIGAGSEPRLACAAGRCAITYETNRPVVRLIEVTVPPSPIDAGSTSADASTTGVDGARGDCGCRSAPRPDGLPVGPGVLLLVALAGLATTSCRRGGG